MKNNTFTALLCILISHTGSRFNNTKDTSPQHSAQNESTNEDNLTLTSALNLTEIGRPSDYFGSGNHLFLYSPSVEMFRAGTGLHAPNGSGLSVTRANDDQTSRFPNQYRGEVATEPPSYARAFVGKNSSGSEVFTSSSTLELATSLAKTIRLVSGRLERLQSYKDLKTEISCSAHPFTKPSTKRKRSYIESANSTRRSLPSFASTFSNVLRSDQENLGYNLRNSETGNRTNFTESKRRDDCTSTDRKKNIVSSTGLPGIITLNLNEKLAYDYYASKYHTALIDACSSLDEPVIVGNITITRSLLTVGTSCSFNVEQSLPSGSGTESGAPASAEAKPERPSGGPCRRELKSESPSTWGQHGSKRLKTRDSKGTVSKTDNSLSNFVAAVNAVQLLMEDLDVYFGSARRLRTSLVERPLESSNLIEEISSYLMMMTCLTNPEAAATFGADSEDRLINLSDSVMYFNEEMWGHIIDINSGGNRDDEPRTIGYLLSMLRELRNEVGGVVESAEPVLEYFHGLPNSVDKEF